MTRPFNFTERDSDTFNRFGLSVELLQQNDVCRMIDREAREFGFQFSPSSNLDGIAFLYYSPAGDRVGARLRRDQPDQDPDVKPKNKYISTFGDRRHLYFIRGCAPLLGDRSVPVVIVEAEKSALTIHAMAQRLGRSFLAIACGGCWGWMGVIGKAIAPNGERVDERGPLPDLFLIDWKQREAIICFDSNAATNDKVRSARRKLAMFLSDQGASVRICEIPPTNGVNGPDDYRAHFGDEALVALLDASVRYQKAVLVEATKAVSSATPDSDLVEISSLIGAVKNNIERETLISMAHKTMRVSKREIEKWVRMAAESLTEEQQQSHNAAHRARLMGVKVDIVELVTEIKSFIALYVYLPEGAALVLSLWIINTWTFKIFDTVAYILLRSPTAGCGKTTVLLILRALCYHAELETGMTEAVLFRLVDQEHPTLLVDEAESLHNNSERSLNIQAVANAGYKKGATVRRVEKEKDRQTLRKFQVFCPKAFAAIGGFQQGALLDRCIVIPLEKAPRDSKLRQVRERVLELKAAPIREKLEAYSLQAAERLKKLSEEEPEDGYWPELLQGREAELWGPSLLHVRGTGLERPALDVAFQYSHRKLEIAAEDDRFMLASELVQLLESSHDKLKEESRFSPKEIVELLEKENDMERHGHWLAELGSTKNDKAKPQKIGRFLKDFRIESTKSHGIIKYSLENAIKKLRAHIPYSPSSPNSLDSADSTNSPGEDEFDRDPTSLSSPIQNRDNTMAGDDGEYGDDGESGEEEPP